MKNLKKIPEFKNEVEERDFWNKNDSTLYIDWKTAKKAGFPKLKPSTRTISIRLPEHLIEEIKILANKNDVPYQSFIKLILKERIDKEYGKSL